MSTRHGFAVGGHETVLFLRELGLNMLMRLLAGKPMVTDAELVKLVALDQQGRTPVPRRLSCPWSGGRKPGARARVIRRLVRRQIRRKRGRKAIKESVMQQLRNQWLLLVEGDRGALKDLWLIRAEAAWLDLRFQRQVAVFLDRYFSRRLLLDERQTATLEPASLWFLLWLALACREIPPWYQRRARRLYHQGCRLMLIARDGWLRPGWARLWDQWLFFEAAQANPVHLQVMRGRILLTLYDLPLWRSLASQNLPVLGEPEALPFWKKPFAKWLQRRQIAALDRAKTEIIPLVAKNWGDQQPAWLVPWMRARAPKLEAVDHV